MSEAPKRRWFRFSLRTLFVVVTVIGIWLGWNFNTAQRRRAALDKARVASENDIVPWAIATAPDAPDQMDSRLAALAASKECRRRGFSTMDRHISAIRRWMGDEPIGLAVFFSEPDFELFRSYFPEATVLLFEDPESYLAAKRSWGLPRTPGPNPSAH
jgi:hypothetical protein